MHLVEETPRRPVQPSGLPVQRAPLRPCFTLWPGKRFPAGPLSSPFFFPAPNVSLCVLPSGSCFPHKGKRALEVQLFNGKSHFSLLPSRIFLWGRGGGRIFLHLCMPHYMCHLTPVDSLSELQFIHMQNRANDSTYLIKLF